MIGSAHLILKPFKDVIIKFIKIKETKILQYFNIRLPFPSSLLNNISFLFNYVIIFRFYLHVKK